MSSAEQIARQLLGLVPSTKHIAMSRVVLQGESIMKREVPVKRGPLRRSINSRVERGGDVGRIGTNNPYARYVHDGTRPHLIRARKAKALKTPNGFYKVVKHPGTRPNPYVDRTAVRLRPVAERELGKVYGDALGKIK